MAITKNIVDMMGGTIKAQTAQGKGAEFIICLPMRTQAEHRPVEKITEPEGLKALVVEDNEPNPESITSNTQWSIAYNNTDLTAEIIIRRHWEDMTRYSLTAGAAK